jgi:hypothetical protein
MSSNLKNLNKFARNNLAILTPITIELLKSGDFRNTPAPIMKCVSCGGWGITTTIMRWFSWDGARFECYQCQEKATRERLLKEMYSGAMRQ